LSGIIADRKGPWLSERLREIGVDATQIQIVGDRAKDMLAALQFMADHRPGRRGGGGADVPPAGDSVGDIDTFKSVVSNPRTGKRLGLTETSYAIFDIAKPGGHGPPARDMTFHCSSITYLRRGLLTAFGSVAFDHQGRISVRPGVITRGTGRYAGARGRVESHQLSEGKSLDIVHLAPRQATPPLSLPRCQRASR